MTRKTALPDSMDGVSSNMTMTKVGTCVTDAEQAWKMIECEIKKLTGYILQGIPKDQIHITTDIESLSLLHCTIYRLCALTSEDYEPQLYERYRKSLERFMSSVTLPGFRKIVKQEQSQGDKVFILKELASKWNDYKTMTCWVSHIFEYLDRHYLRLMGLPSLNEVSMTCFREGPLYHEIVLNIVRDAIIDLIDKEREGEEISDPASLKNVVSIFSELGMECYKNDFESHMLKDTTCYYSKKASLWFNTVSCADYVLRVEEHVKKEKHRIAQQYLHAGSERKLLEIVENELLYQYMKPLLEKLPSVYQNWLRGGELDYLARMHAFFSYKPKGLECMAQSFKLYVAAEGEKLVAHTEQQADAVANHKKEDSASIKMQELFARKVIKLHKKCSRYVDKCFRNGSLFIEALREVFESLCDNEIAGTPSAEVFATFCHNTLKKKASFSSHENPPVEDTTLEDVVKVLVYVKDKVGFVEFYRQKLGRRLLSYESANGVLELERGMLVKLKQLCGPFLISKMDGMLTDFTSTMEIQTSFEGYLNQNPLSHAIPLNIMVLTKPIWPTLWPTYDSFDSLTPPPEMAASLERFGMFYKSREPKRKLTWIFTLGRCDMIAWFDTTPIKIVLSPYQACVLMLFNASESLSSLEVMSGLNLTAPDTARLLHSLTYGKYRVLRKISETGTITPSDYFELNKTFPKTMSMLNNKKKKIRIPLEEAGNKEKYIEVVEQDRSAAIQACIARLMKRSNVLDHSELVRRCQLELQHFLNPDSRAIKEQIEKLIEKEVLEREIDNPFRYRYLP